MKQETKLFTIAQLTCNTAATGGLIVGHYIFLSSPLLQRTALELSSQGWKHLLLPGSFSIMPPILVIYPGLLLAMTAYMGVAAIMKLGLRYKSMRH